MEAATATAPGKRLTEVPEEPDEAKPNGEPLDGEGDGETAPPKVPPLEIDGAGSQLTLSVGGEVPNVSQVKLRGGSIAIRAGEFKKGDVVELAIRARCVEIDVVDKIDGQTGDVTETIRRHVFKAVHVEKV
jgi:hypothetical protein